MYNQSKELPCTLSKILSAHYEKFLVAVPKFIQSKIRSMLSDNAEVVPVINDPLTIIEQ